MVRNCAVLWYLLCKNDVLYYWFVKIISWSFNSGGKRTMMNRGERDIFLV
jgi:hypothetical protein